MLTCTDALHARTSRGFYFGTDSHISLFYRVLPSAQGLTYSQSPRRYGTVVTLKKSRKIYAVFRFRF